MGNFAIINPAVYVDGTDMSGFLKKISIHPTVDELDVTTFGAVGRGRIGGLRTVDFSADGFMDTLATPDIELFPNLGLKDNPISATAQGAETNTAWMWLAGETAYDQFDVVGSAAPFTFSGKSTNPQGLVRGQLGAAKRVQAATGQLGSSLNLGAPVAGQYVYAIVHAHAVGTTVTIQVQSDTATNFPTPNTRGTFSAITAVGGYWLVRVAGPFAGQTWWRLNISAITGSFTLSGSIGIGS